MKPSSITPHSRPSCSNGRRSARDAASSRRSAGGHPQVAGRHIGQRRSGGAARRLRPASVRPAGTVSPAAAGVRRPAAGGRRARSPPSPSRHVQRADRAAQVGGKELQRAAADVGQLLLAGEPLGQQRLALAQPGLGLQQRRPAGAARPAPSRRSRPGPAGRARPRQASRTPTTSISSDEAGHRQDGIAVGRLAAARCAGAARCR